MQSAYQIYNGKVCVRGSAVIRRGDNKGILPSYIWDKWLRTGANLMLKGGNGRSSLIEFDSIPSEMYKSLLKMTYGDPRGEAATNTFLSKCRPDDKAREFYSNYMLPDGRHLPIDVQTEYCNNASILNALAEVLSNSTEVRKALGGGKIKNFWGQASEACKEVKPKIAHTLPANAKRLQMKFKEYQTKGYACLVSGKYCNDNSRKVTFDIERLILSIYTMKNKPFARDVHEIYDMFISGKIQIADRETGELYEVKNCLKNGAPVAISKSTVWNYLNLPHNRAIVNSMRSGQHRFNAVNRPHHHRHAPVFSLSKVSMDDRDLTRLLPDGNRVKAYYAYDVTSGCVIGRA